ncbi:MAG: dihydroorotate dehydrogenase electron transfer subunit [Desulfarculus sp.]|nr:dihydroorotate dehydrogenase electron transfer subunit [Desulfarculus sp.]
MGAIWAEVKENRKLGEGIYRLTLHAPAIAPKARPGQFVMLRVAHGNDPLLARPFSIHGAAGEELLILYKVVGRGTRILSQVRTGKTLFLWGPLGRGFDLSGERPVLVAGGMGIAPMAFAARWLAAQGRPAAFCAGLPGLAGWEHLARGLEEELAGSLSLAWSSEDGSLGRRGLVTELLSDTLAAAGASSGGVLACGPMPMLRAVARVCAQRGVACQVSLEAPMACGLGACLGCAIPAAGGGYLRACQEGPVLAAAAVDWERV